MRLVTVTEELVEKFTPGNRDDTEGAQVRIGYLTINERVPQTGEGA